MNLNNILAYQGKANKIQTTKSSSAIGLEKKKKLQAYTQPYSAKHWK
jgi:hypothetical protein